MGENSGIIFICPGDNLLLAVWKYIGECFDVGKETCLVEHYEMDRSLIIPENKEFFMRELEKAFGYFEESGKQKPSFVFIVGHEGCTDGVEKDGHLALIFTGVQLLKRWTDGKGVEVVGLYVNKDGEEFVIERV